MTSSKPRPGPGTPEPKPGAPADAPRGGGPAHPHARFIPREELAAFAAWTPGHIAGGPTASPGVHRAASPVEPPKPDAAEASAAALRAATQVAYQDGYRDGLVALEGFKKTFLAQTSAQVGALIESLDSELSCLQQDLARTVAVCATHLARQIVRAELEARPELVAVVAQEAVDTLLLSARHITLRVHPGDHALVAQGTAEVLQARGARLVADPTMTRGGCRVESDIGVVDAAIETRWRRACASLGCDEAWQADEPGDAGSHDANSNRDARAAADNPPRGDAA